MLRRLARTFVEKRHRPALASVLLLASLPGCVGFAQGGGVELHTRLALEVSAWIAAEVGRAELPGADPEPRAPSAPIERHADGSFVVRCARTTRGEARVAMNGRIGRHGGEQIGFVPAPEATAIRGGLAETITIRLCAGPDGTVIQAAAPAAVLAHLRTALEFAETERPPAGIPDGAPCCDRHRGIAATLRLRAARLAEQHQDPESALALASASLALEDGFAARAVRERAAGALAHHDTGTLERSFRSRAPLAATRDAGAPPRQSGPAALADEARRQLARGDLVPATRYARRVCAETRGSAEGFGPLAEVQRAQGDRAGALELALLQFTLEPDQPERTLELHDALAATGRCQSALSLLATRAGELPLGPEVLGPRLLATSARLPAARATRILVAGGADRFTAAPLQRWLESDGAWAGALALARVPALRLQSPAATRPGAETRGFEAAPGVAPLR